MKGGAEEVPSIMAAVNSIWKFSPSTITVFLVLVSVRIFSALFNNINDCDETFNYWEPAHYLLHGEGLQTWEYSPVYAVRSYAYILINMAPLFLITGLSSKIAQFYLLRILFAVVSSACESYLYSAVKRRLSSRVSLLFFLFLVPSCGMYISSTAFLPSSFTMYCTMVSMAAWLNHEEHIAIFAVALGSILGWPFASVLGIPLAVNVLFRQRRIFFFIKCSILSLIIIGVPVLVIDSQLYGRIVFAPLNIVLYNVFGKGGPDLYGTEPWTYYFINGFLNLNVSFLLCLLCLPIIEFKLFSDRYIQKMPEQQQQKASIYRPIIMAVIIWFAIFFTRPHKEERFLFPVYPLIHLCAAISLHLMYDLVPTVEFMLRLDKSYRFLCKLVKSLTAFFLIVHAVLSISRISLLYTGYSAPMKVYSELSADYITEATQSLQQVNLCVGKEWYRYPSSFFLPAGDHSHSKWKLRFVKSEFRGQLPKPYSSLPNATAVIPTHMNDMNQEEPSRYFSVGSCDYLIDVESAVGTEFEPKYHSNTAVWERVYSFGFLDSKQSVFRLFRAFYIPHFSVRISKFVRYHLLHNLLK